LSAARPSGSSNAALPDPPGSRTSRIAWSKSMYCAARLPPEASCALLPQFT
jgi:hypothetical protein